MNWKNWKTTAAGASAMLIAAGNLAAAVSVSDWPTAATNAGIIVAGIVGLVAKDNNVTGGTVTQPSK